MSWAETLYGLTDRLFGLSAKAQELGFGQMAARAFVMYVALLIVVRSGKKRFLGRATAFDIVLVITLGSIASRAITGGTVFFAAMLALVVLVFTHWVFSWLAREFRLLQRSDQGAVHSADQERTARPSGDARRAHVG